MRCALHSTPSAQTAMSVRRESRQSEERTEWCGSPPLSVSLGAAGEGAVGGAAGLVAGRGRFLGAISEGVKRNGRASNLLFIPKDARTYANLQPAPTCPSDRPLPAHIPSSGWFPA